MMDGVDTVHVNTQSHPSCDARGLPAPGIWLKRAGLLCLLLAQPGLAQNLVINGQFDQNTSTGWENPEAPPAMWSALDVQGVTSSGSARLINSSATASNRRVVLRQCVVALPPGSYSLRVFGLVPDSQATSGRLVVSFNMRVSPDCSGNAFSLGGFFVDFVGAWEDGFTSLLFPGDVASGSIELLISVEKDDAGGEFVAHIDAIEVRGPPLFGDGFE